MIIVSIYVYLHYLDRWNKAKTLYILKDRYFVENKIYIGVQLVWKQSKVCKINLVLIPKQGI